MEKSNKLKIIKNLRLELYKKNIWFSYGTKIFSTLLKYLKIELM